MSRISSQAAACLLPADVRSKFIREHPHRSHFRISISFKNCFVGWLGLKCRAVKSVVILEDVKIWSDL